MKTLIALAIVAGTLVWIGGRLLANAHGSAIELGIAAELFVGAGFAVYHACRRWSRTRGGA